MLDYNLILTFASLTIVETITPGPTLGLVLYTKLSSGKMAALRVTLGVAVANVTWILIAMVLMRLGASLPDWGISGIKLIGTACLIIVASKRVLSSLVVVITGASECRDESHHKKQFTEGFIAHFFNPVSPIYYLGVFTSLSGHSMNNMVAFGIVAVVFDLLFYAFLASFKFFGIGDVLNDQGGVWITGILRLVAGFFLLYITTTSIEGLSYGITKGAAFVMLIGFLAAVIGEVMKQVGQRKGKNNKGVWKIAALWSACFTILALIGVIFTLIDGISNSKLNLGHNIIHHLRICFMVATVTAAALSFAKSYGELQDEQYPNSDGSSSINIQGWKSSPIKVVGACFLCLGVVFLLLTLSGFVVQ